MRRYGSNVIETERIKRPWVQRWELQLVVVRSRASFYKEKKESLGKRRKLRGEQAVITNSVRKFLNFNCWGVKLQFLSYQNWLCFAPIL